MSASREHREEPATVVLATAVEDLGSPRCSRGFFFFYLDNLYYRVRGPGAELKAPININTFSIRLHYPSTRSYKLLAPNQLNSNVQTRSPEWTTAFLICSSRVPLARLFTIAHGHPAWLLDFEIRPIGTVVQQRIWAPQNEAQRLAHAPQNMPIFFVLNGHVTLGLTIVTAAARDHMTLRGAGTPAPVSECLTLSTNEPGYWTP
ncbi:hypothetical protein V8E53_010450 [Lactarius tabidus]